MARHRLIELDWPTFGPDAPPPPAEVAEFLPRLQAARSAMEQHGYSHLVVYADREHFANLAYLTHFDPRFEEALLVLRLSEKPLLIVGNECEAYLPISPLWQAGDLRAERFQPFSLLDQPRDASREMADILASEGIGPQTNVGCVGWKYYGHPHWMDLPSYLVDTLRALAGHERVTDATALFQHPDSGLRARCTAFEIAQFEHSNRKASAALRRVHFAARVGMTDHELLAHAGYDGTPLACHMTLKTGPRRVSLSSPSGNVVEKGYPWSANISYWGSNICRANWVADSEADLPEPARDYIAAFAGPYFEAMGVWFHMLRIGQSGGAIEAEMQRLLPFDRFGIFLNSGHLIHLDEWVSSPIYAGSTVPIASGMVFQSDVIPSSKTYFSTRAEDGYAVADAALRQELQRRFPACFSRCQARRQFVTNTLGVALPEEVLPLSDMACLVAPFLLQPRLLLTLSP